MMKRTPAISLLTTALLLGVIPGSRGNQVLSQPDVLLAVGDLEKKLNWTDYRLNLERWHRAGGSTTDSLDFFKRLRHEVLADPETYDALRGHRSKISGNADLRRYDLAYPMVVRAQIDGSRLVGGLRDSLSSFFAQPWCRVNGATISKGQAQAMVTASRGRTTRVLAYRAMSDPGDQIERQMAHLFRLRNQATRRIGYNDYLSLSLDLDSDEEDAYLQFIDAVDSLTRSDFAALVLELQRSMGSDQLELFHWENRFARTMAEVDALFPVDSQKVFLRRFAQGLGFNVERLPIYWRESLDTGETGRSTALMVVPAHDIRIVTELTEGLQSFRHLVRALGLALQGAMTTQESSLLARSVHPAWTAGMATLFDMLLVQTDWLRSLTGCSGDLQTRLSRAERATRLLRLRLLVVDAKFEYAAYRNPTGNLNSQYWDIFEELTGLPRHDDLAPWAGNEAFVLHPFEAYHRLLGVCAAAQNLDYLRSHYPKPVDNRELGAFLTHNYFRYGARYDWRELIERATDHTLSPSYLSRL